MPEKALEILLVEDNPSDVELTLRALNKCKLANSIHVVRDGPEALDFIFCRGAYARRSINTPPTLVLLELKLPKLDGKEVLQRIQSDSRARTIRVVVLASSREERDIVDSCQLGVDSYITKPVDFDKFVDAIKQLGLYWLLFNEPPQVARGLA